uniref:DUF7716 domain-containing protein n=1 Tax=Yersinia aldovae TaxID=29483 RepID=UPI000A4FF0F3|nr:hypothetical protein [Yersinia aldovae]
MPIQVESDGWVETLDGASVEDIIDNVGYQLADPKIEQLFEAFTFYYENDAFIELLK